MKKIYKVRNITNKEIINKYSANAKELWRDYMRRMNRWNEEEDMEMVAYEEHLNHMYEEYKDRMLFGW